MILSKCLTHPFGSYKCFRRALYKHNTVAIMSITVLFIACNCHPADCSQSFNAVKLLNTYCLIPPLNFCSITSSYHQDCFSLWRICEQLSYKVGHHDDDKAWRSFDIAKLQKSVINIMSDRWTDWGSSMKKVTLFSLILSCLVCYFFSFCILIFWVK